MIIKIATMHGESHLTFMVEWIRGFEGLFEEQIPEALCGGHSTWTGRPFVTKLAKMSEPMKENERMRVMMAFPNYLPRKYSLRFSKTFPPVSFLSHPQMTQMRFASIMIFFAFI